MNFRICQFLSNEERVRLVARHLALANALRQVLVAFTCERICVAPLRGPALAEQLYGDPATRPCGDLDVLVRKAQLDQVKAVLSELDYRLCDRRPGFAQEFSYTFEFFKTHPVPIIVEPHWTIAYPPFMERLDMEVVWQMLRREDCLLNLCLHLVHHANDGEKVIGPTRWTRRSCVCVGSIRQSPW